ncbi:MAG: hypothetical protein ACLF0P_00365 [Thermoanaerobaculia bacterium]
MPHPRTRQLATPLLVLVLAVTGCRGMGAPGGGEPPPPTPERTVVGEVAWVDPGERQIEVRSRTGDVVAWYDAGTRVLFEGREDSPENLEPGDRVRMEVSGAGARNLYAERIEVTDSVAERRPAEEPREESFAADVLAGEVQAVDLERREIRLETDEGERFFAFDRRTRVFYQGEEYRPENLEWGDLVEIEVADTGAREPYAERIEVTRAVQEREDVRTDTGPGFERDRVTGTVEWIDGRLGEFGLETGGGEVLTVRIPFDARERVRERFSRLDRGDRVEVEVTPLDGDRVSLVRFL